MRLDDIGDYLQLRKLCDNPFEVLRYRKRQHEPGNLVVQLKGHPPLHIRGAHFDFHAFHRIWLRDEYRIDPLVKRGLGTVVDLGGNVGMFATRAARHAQRVISCEPVPENFTQLQANLGGAAGATALPVAVTDRVGSLTIHIPSGPENSGCWSAHRERERDFGDGTLEVPTTTLVEVFEEHDVDQVDLLKIDVEGGEYDILPHAAEHGLLQRIARIHGEYHDVRRADPTTRIDAFQAWLSGEGYQVVVVPHRKRPNHGMFFATRTT